MKGDPPLIRQWTLLQRLSARRLGLTVRELAAEAEVGEKTIRRDLDRLRSVGFPLQDQAGDNGLKRWRLETLPREAQPGYTIETFPKAVREQFLENYRKQYPEQRATADAIRPKNQEEYLPPRGYDDHRDHRT